MSPGRHPQPCTTVQLAFPAPPHVRAVWPTSASPVTWGRGPKGCLLQGLSDRTPRAPHSRAPALRHHNAGHAGKGVAHGCFQGDPLAPPQGACLPADTLTALQARRQHAAVPSPALTQRQHALAITRHGDRSEGRTKACAGRGPRAPGTCAWPAGSAPVSWRRAFPRLRPRLLG